MLAGSAHTPAAATVARKSGIGLRTKGLLCGYVMIANKLPQQKYISNRNSNDCICEYQSQYRILESQPSPEFKLRTLFKLANSLEDFRKPETQAGLTAPSTSAAHKPECEQSHHHRSARLWHALNSECNSLNPEFSQSIAGKG